ncbi:elongation factor P [Patescibacteria group bacterium]|nr:elongation factor P [Patescibacteria group bacterium]
MATTQNIVNGIAINHKGSPWIVIGTQFVNPGKGMAFTKTKMRNLKTGQVLEETIKSGTDMELADVERKKCQFLYTDNSGFHFMDNDSYEQFSLDQDTIGENKKWLLDGTDCYALHIDGQPVSIQIPPKMQFTIKETVPGVKGDTAQGGSKEAVIETGTVIKVPLFIKEGEKVIVNTETGDYVSKA